MLETILKEINGNLERIAIALVEISKGTAVQHIAQAMPEQQPQIAKIQQSQQPMTSVIPTTVETENFTQDQLAVAMSNAVSNGKMDLIMGILQQFNVQALTQINPKDYNKLATMLKEAGVKI